MTFCNLVKVTFLVGLTSCAGQVTPPITAYYEVSINGGPFEKTTTGYVPAPPGEDVFVIEAYSASGQYLFTNTATQTIAEGAQNTVQP